MTGIAPRRPLIVRLAVRLLDDEAFQGLMLVALTLGCVLAFVSGLLWAASDDPMWGWAMAILVVGAFAPVSLWAACFAIERHHGGTPDPDLLADADRGYRAWRSLPENIQHDTADLVDDLRSALAAAAASPANLLLRTRVTDRADALVRMSEAAHSIEDKALGTEGLDHATGWARVLRDVGEEMSPRQ